MGTTLSVDALVERLGLQPHPEGGFFRETFRSNTLLSLPDGRVRAASTAIYFLLPEGTFSAFHRVASDEAWHFYDGDALELVMITPEGQFRSVTLGHDLVAGEEAQAVVPAGVWQAARPVPKAGKEAGYSLVGCTVAPGFDFADFEMPPRKQLERLFPAHAGLIATFTRE